MKLSKYLRKLTHHETDINFIKNYGKVGKKITEKKSLIRVI